MATIPQEKNLPQSDSGMVDTNIVANMTVRQLFSIYTAVERDVARLESSSLAIETIVQQGGKNRESILAALAMAKQLKRFNFTEKGERLKVKEVAEIADVERRSFLQIHTVNHIAHYACIDFYDWLCDKKYIGRFSKAEVFWRKADRVFEEYRENHLGGLEPSVRSLLETHVSMMNGHAEPLLAAMEVTVRDYLIQRRQEFVAAGQKDDIALLSKAAVTLSLLTTMERAWRDYFSQTVNEHGVDFSREFRYASLNKMARNMVFLCESLGLRFDDEGNGERTLRGIHLDSSVRVSSAWAALMRMLEDGELADETAARAIAVNPEANEEYHEIFADAERKHEAQKQAEMQEAFKQLEEKFKVTKI